MHTTIAVSLQVREQIKEYGNKGETYDEILSRLLRSAKERQLQELLMDTSDSTPAKVVLARARTQWQ